jgi:hypothetical protein
MISFGSGFQYYPPKDRKDGRNEEEGMDKLQDSSCVPLQRGVLGSQL